MQNELDDLTAQVSTEDFTPAQKEQANMQLQQVMDELRTIQVGQQMTYDDLITELQELRALYFLNKKNWMQLFTGKVTEWIAGGVVSESISKEIVDLVKNHLPK